MVAEPKNDLKAETPHSSGPTTRSPSRRVSARACRVVKSIPSRSVTPETKEGEMKLKTALLILAILGACAWTIGEAVMHAGPQMITIRSAYRRGGHLMAGVWAVEIARRAAFRPDVQMNVRIGNCLR